MLRARVFRNAALAVPTLFANQVSAKICNGGHVCTPPQDCCSLGCCYTPSPAFPRLANSVTDMFLFLFSYYWYLWIAVLAGLILAGACSCWLCRRKRRHMMEEGATSDRTSTGSCYLPPHYSRCSSANQAMPPPYNEVTSKPDLYPLVIGYDDGFGKGASGFVMRYFRSLSHASTLDSLSSSFMCNVVNEANTIRPPPYSCNNSIDELSSVGSIISLSTANHRTTSDISSLAASAQSPSSPPRATSPTIELRELLDKIQQLPQLPGGQQSRPQFLCPVERLQRPASPVEAVVKTKRTRGKMYVSVGPPVARNKTKNSWLSRSAPTTPSGTIPMSFLPGHSGRRPSGSEGNKQQVVPLLSEQDESETNNADNV